MYSHVLDARNSNGLSACRLVMRSGLGRAERGGVHSLSTDCGLDLDGPITVSPYDPPPALLSGSRRLARLAGPTPARAWPTYLPLPEPTTKRDVIPVPGAAGRLTKPTVPAFPARAREPNKARLRCIHGPCIRELAAVYTQKPSLPQLALSYELVQRNHR